MRPSTALGACHGRVEFACETNRITRTARIARGWITRIRDCAALIAVHPHCKDRRGSNFMLRHAFYCVLFAALLAGRHRGDFTPYFNPRSEAQRLTYAALLYAQIGEQADAQRAISGALAAAAGSPIEEYVARVATRKFDAG